MTSESDEMLVSVTFSTDPVFVSSSEYYQYGAPIPVPKKPRTRRKKISQEPAVPHRPSWHGRSDLDTYDFDQPLDDYGYSDYYY